MKLIGHYKKWMKSEKMPHFGLCRSVPHQYYETLELFKPYREKRAFWAAEGIETSTPKEYSHFNDIRKTIVLFICAIHNEI